ncbi:hypothetical protein LXL04_034807 [Taraxacum kok-saghyz]
MFNLWNSKLIKRERERKKYQPLVEGLQMDNAYSTMDVSNEESSAIGIEDAVIVDKQKELKKDVEMNTSIMPPMSNREVIASYYGVTSNEEITLKTPKGIRNKGCGPYKKRMISDKEKAIEKSKKPRNMIHYVKQVLMNRRTLIHAIRASLPKSFTAEELDCKVDSKQVSPLRMLIHAEELHYEVGRNELRKWDGRVSLPNRKPQIPEDLNGPAINSYISENQRTFKPLTFSKNRLRRVKNRSNTSPISNFCLKNAQTRDMFYRSLHNTYLKGFERFVGSRSRFLKRVTVWEI